MRRIYLEIYLSVIGASLLVALVVSLFSLWYFEGRREAERDRLTRIGGEIAAALPPAGDEAALQDALRAAADVHQVRLVLWSDDERVVASAGRRRAHRPPPPPDGQRGPGRHPPRHHRGPRVVVPVPQPLGGELEIASKRGDRRLPRGPWVFAVALLAGVAIAAYPTSRRIARGLERLRAGVSELGEGDLDARVEVEGRGEVADVARAFNAAAEKIQRLVEAQGRVIASASHELRSPLGRLRAAVELLAEGRAEHLPEAERSIAELDGLIEDLLLAARLGATDAVCEPVDLRALCVEEAEGVGAELDAEGEVRVVGDVRLLRRMVRNLLENAERHGAPPVVMSIIGDAARGRVVLRVHDSGGGVPEVERERIFEPFYRPSGHSEGRDGGVGLGLALVAEIAGKHGGAARCVADSEHGSAFEVDLPMRPGVGD